MDYPSLLLDASDELLMLVEPATLKILAVNRKTCDELGYTPAELIGLQVSDIECALSDLFFWEEMRDAPSEKMAESSLRRADGSVIEVVKTVRRIGMPQFPSPDEVDGVFAIRASAIGKQQQIEHDLAHLDSRLRATLEATADGILLVDREGHILNMNRRFSKMWQLTQAQLLNRDDKMIFRHMAEQLERKTEDDADADRETDGLPLEARSDVLEESFDILRLADGRVFERNAGIAWEDEQIIGRVFSYRDVTERHRTQQELLAANEEVRRASRAKGDFLAMMSHEIRTPMNAIIGINQLMLDGELDEQQREYAKSIAGSAESLLVIINDILDFSKIEAGRMEIERIAFDLHETLDDVVKLHGFRATEKNLRFNFQVAPNVPEQITSDPTRIRQILGNFLSNALKFTSSGEVSLDVERNESLAGPLLRFTISDTGIGISAEAQGKLFTPFTQADSTTTRRYGGTGLGLAITKQLVELLGGTISLKSVENQGTTFTVLLPLAETVAWEPLKLQTPARPASADAPAPKAARLLLVEDNPTNQIVALGMLRKFGYSDIVTANNGAEAVAAATKDAFDAILMDCQMPVMDGYTATETLRSQGCRTPIIAMTANAMQSDREKCLAAGMNDFITKPINRREFEAALTRWVTSSQRAQETEGNTSANEADRPAETLAVFNRQAALELYDGDQDLFDIVLRAFVTDTPTTLASLRTALHARNAGDARTYAHGIKGAAGSVGADALVDTARRMEMWAKEGKIEPASDALPTLEQQFAEFTKAIDGER